MHTFNNNYINESKMKQCYIKSKTYRANSTFNRQQTLCNKNHININNITFLKNTIKTMNINLNNTKL